jgi:hypothetical protein
MHPEEFKRHVVTNYGVSESEYERLHEEFLAYFAPTLEEFVRDRHLELQRSGRKNPEIFRLIQAEAAKRRFGVEELSERRIRRIVYG